MTDPAATRFLVLWSDDRSANLGVRALAEGAVSLIKRLQPDAEVVLQDFAPNADGFSLGREAILGQVRRREITRWASQFDVVLDTGAGDSFADIYGLKRLLMMTISQRAVLKSGVPLILLPQTIGPFNTWPGRAMARRTVAGAEAVYARDSSSAARLKQLGRSAALLTTDLVFAIPPGEPEGARDVVVNPSGLLWDSNGHVDSSLYRQQLMQFVERLIATGRSVSFLAHVLPNDTTDDDVRCYRDLKTQFGSSVELIVPRDLRHARSIIAGCRVLIGARMHACLNAISQGIPAIPWAYSDKFAPLLSDLGFSAALDIRRDPDIAAATLRLLQDEDVLGDAAHRAKTIARNRIDELAIHLGRVIPHGS